MGSEMKTISYEYDSVGNRTLMIDPDGGRATYAYDVLNRISSLINPQGERTTYAYDPKGRRTLKKLANGTRASFTYDAANRLTTLANLKSDNSVISKFDYKYDKVGNKTSVVEADGSRVSRIYDNTYQLIGEHRTGSSPYRNTFTYDSVGNRLLKNENNARTTYAYDDAHQLKTSVDAQGTTTYTFDDDGNQELVQAPTSVRTTTTWDYENKTTLVQLLTGLRNTMSYEPDGLRVKLEDSSGTKKFIWDNQTYLAETDENNDTQAVYTNEPSAYGNLISQYRKPGAIWTPSYYHQEALGSTRELTNSAEAITDTYVYDAWGNVISSTGTTINPFQYTGNVGYYFDQNTGNFYIRARIYRPAIGRWLSADPLGFVDGDNLYLAYFVPTGVDPSGLQSETPFLPSGTDPLEPIYKDCASMPVELWSPRVCDLYHPCENCKCEDAKQPEHYSLRDLFNRVRKLMPNTDCLAFYTIAGVKTKVKNGKIEVVGPGNCAPGADRPLALTCSFLDENGKPAAAVCLPEGAWSYCTARSILLHELKHVQDICTGKAAGMNPAQSEKRGYTVQCNALADQSCIFGDKRPEFIQNCLTKIGGISGGGNRKPIIKGCKKLIDNHAN